MPEEVRPGRRVSIDTGSESNVKQQFKDDSDVNLIVANYGKMGVFSNINPLTPQYGDFSTALDLQQAIELTRLAEERFMALPSTVRGAADNNPVRFLQMMETEQGQAILQRAGMVTQINFDQAEPAKVADAPKEA